MDDLGPRQDPPIDDRVFHDHLRGYQPSTPPPSQMIQPNRFMRRARIPLPQTTMGIESAIPKATRTRLPEERDAQELGDDGDQDESQRHRAEGPTDPAPQLLLGPGASEPPTR